MSVGRETSESIPWTRHTDTRHAYRREPRGFITNTSAFVLSVPLPSSSLPPYTPCGEILSRRPPEARPDLGLCPLCVEPARPISGPFFHLQLILLSFFLSFSLRASNIDEMIFPNRFPLPFFFFFRFFDSLDCSYTRL